MKHNGVVMRETAVQDRTNSGRLVAVVVTYNRLEKLQETLARLLQSPADHLQAVIVVDNASDDGTSDWLAAQPDPRLAVLRMDKNLGGAGGFEAGLRHAVGVYDPDWMVVMDDDGRPAPGALAHFQGADLSGWDAVAAAVYFPSGEICDINRPSNNPFWHPKVLRATLLGVISGGLLGRARDAFHVVPADYASDIPKEIDAASFVGLFLSRAAVGRAGFPDGRLFIYGDDVLYTLGLRAAGGRMAFWPGIHFEHDFSTILADERRFRPLWKSYYHHRNLLMVYRFAAGIYFWPVLLVILPKWLLKARHHRGQRWRYLGLILRAIGHGLARRTDVSLETVRRWSGEG